MRVGPWNNGKTLAFFNVAFGQETDEGLEALFVVKDFALRPKNAGGYWVEFPNKLRRKKNSDGSYEYVKGDDGFTIKDNYFDIAFTGEGESRKPVKASLDFKQQLTEAAEKLYDRLNTKGSGGSRKSAALAGATSSRVSEGTKGTPVDDDNEEEFPF